MRPLRVGLNMLFLIPEWVGGTERYATALLEALVRAAPDDEYHVFLSAEAAALALPAHPSVHRVVCRTSARRRPFRYLWEQIVLPGQLARRRIDVVHSLGYVGPLVSPCRRVVTVCDANYVVLRDFTTAVKRHVVPFFVRQSARRADHVLTLSHHAAAEIVADTGIDPGRITVTHLGGRESEAARADVAWPALAERYGLTKPYLLAFGGLNPHKNMPGLLEAFSRLGGGVPHRLVLAGRIANLPALEKKYLEALGDRVCLAGYVPDALLRPLLRNAELFLFPTLYEGFGLPVLEAQELGVPVACSRVGSLPEVAGDSVFFFDPLRPDDMAAAITRCLADAALRDELVLKGHANVRRFSWAEAAAITRGVYRKVLGLPPPGAPGARDAPSPAGPPRV